MSHVYGLYIGAGMSGLSDAEKAVLKKMRAAEYERWPDRMARSLAYSYERARQKKKDGNYIAPL